MWQWLSDASSIIILVAAVCVAIANIYKFFANGKKGIQDKVEDARASKEQEEEKRVRAIVSQMQEEQSAATKQLILSIMGEALPGALEGHYKNIRDKFKNDRERYLHDITDEVTRNIQDSLDAVEVHEDRMTVFTEVLKELLRERIMAIYRRNKSKRTLEEHEKIELDRSYASYKSIKGNSYIDEYYARMESWEIIADDYHHNH